MLEMKNHEMSIEWYDFQNISDTNLRTFVFFFCGSSQSEEEEEDHIVPCVSQNNLKRTLHS